MNLRNRQTVARHLRVADSLGARLRGLIGRREMIPGEEGLLIPTPVGIAQIHTLFMRFPLEVLYLDAAGRVMKADSIRPWRIGPLVRHCRWVLELPAGTIGVTDTHPGDAVQFVIGHSSRFWL